MARILALSSHVVRGSVGLAATVPALQSLGHEVWALPTVTLAARPGLGAAATKAAGRRTPSPKELTGMLTALEQDGCWPMLDAVFTGYFASAEAVAAVAATILRIKAAKPSVRLLVDPIIGDGGRLYVPEATALAIRDQLLPLADISTPNLFELEWLTGSRNLDSTDEIVTAARRLGPPSVVVTSARSTETEIVTLLVTPSGVREAATARLPDIPNGSGDLLDGLLLGHLLEGRSESAAMRGAVRNLARVLEASVGRDVLQLGVLNFP